MVWVEQKTNIYKEWEEKEVLEGVYVGEEEKFYKIDNGKEIENIKKTSLLVAGLKDVRIGNKVRITYEGVQPTKSGFELMIFKVEKWVEKY
jgi:hypothetical protein